jgi:hypothetical protein
MKVITPAMDEAMREAGFTRRRTRWRRETPDLPVVVYQERPDTGGPHYGFTILYGYPYRDPEEWGCFQLSQREVCRGSDHYYDVTRPGELDQLERDFLDFTVAVAARYSTGLELARALQHGEIPSSQPERKGVGLVRDLLDIAQAHGLDGVRQEVFAMARQLDSSRRVMTTSASWPSSGPSWRACWVPRMSGCGGVAVDGGPAREVAG